jgi:hypothetical protein
MSKVHLDTLCKRLDLARGEVLSFGIDGQIPLWIILPEVYLWRDGSTSARNREYHNGFVLRLDTEALLVFLHNDQLAVPALSGHDLQGEDVLVARDSHYMDWEIYDSPLSSINLNIRAVFAFSEDVEAFEIAQGGQTGETRYSLRNKREIANYLRRSESWVRDMLKKGLPHRKADNRRVLADPDELDAWMKKQSPH